MGPLVFEIAKEKGIKLRDLSLKANGNFVSIFSVATFDFTLGNATKKGNAFPIPNIELMLNRLQEAKILSTIVLSMAYHQSVNAAQSRRVIAAQNVPFCYDIYR